MKERKAKVTRVHHIGLKVKDWEKSVETWRNTFGMEPDRTEIYDEWGVKLAFYKIGETYVILVADAGLNPNMSESLKKVFQFSEDIGEGFFHMAFLVDDIDTMHKEMKENNVQLWDKEVYKEGYDGSRYAFIDPSQTANALVHLYEADW